MKKIVIISGVAALVAATPVFAQTAPGTSTPEKTPQAPQVRPAPPFSATTPKAASDELMNKSVYSSDDKNLGSVAAVTRDTDGKVNHIEADIGGFLGIGQHRISVSPSQYKVVSDRIVLSLTADQAKALPEVAKK